MLCYNGGHYQGSDFDDMSSFFLYAINFAFKYYNPDYEPLVIKM
jgi:hypothetical protein